MFMEVDGCALDNSGTVTNAPRAMQKIIAVRQLRETSKVFISLSPINKPWIRSSVETFALVPMNCSVQTLWTIPRDRIVRSVIAWRLALVLWRVNLGRARSRVTRRIPESERNCVNAAVAILHTLGAQLHRLV